MGVIMILISRRNLLKKAGGLLAASAIIPALSSCKKSNTKEQPTLNAKEEPAQPFSCNDDSSLSGEQKAIRANLRYTDITPISSRTCDNCKLYNLPKKGASCGGCKILPGPVHPKGWCSSWYVRM